MIQLQLLNKILSQRNIHLILRNALTAEYFVQYTPEFEFIMQHYQSYGNVPDTETFAEQFPEFDLLDVQESDKYLVETIKEEHLYRQMVPIITNAAQHLKQDANLAAEYALEQFRALSAGRYIEGTDIISQSQKRLDDYTEKKDGKEEFFIPTGFAELDDIIKGLSRGEEFFLILARTGQGKSWILVKMLEHAWSLSQGYRVGMISPEMSPERVGYRFDTLVRGFSNSALIRGGETGDYAEYIKELQGKEGGFIVAEPRDFQSQITVSKLRAFCENNQLSILGIDGIRYLVDERAGKSDTTRQQYAHISEDLFKLSRELRIPIIAAVQSNRSGVRKDGSDPTPDVDNVEESDDIARNSSKILAVGRNNAGLNIVLKKNRDGEENIRLIYHWHPDRGTFEYIPSTEDSAQPEKRKKKMDDLKNEFGDSDVF